MIKTHKNNIREDVSYIACVSWMSRVTPWLRFPGFGGFAFDEFCTADVFYASDDDLFDVRSFVTYFMTDTQPFNIQSVSLRMYGFTRVEDVFQIPRISM
jgi:hypothetical protein